MLFILVMDVTIVVAFPVIIKLALVAQYVIGVFLAVLMMLVFLVTHVMLLKY